MEPPARKKPSLHDLMKDGCGIVDPGVSDLATNKTRLRLRLLGERGHVAFHAGLL